MKLLLSPCGTGCSHQARGPSGVRAKSRASIFFGSVSSAKRFDGFTLHAAFTAGDTATALLGASGCGKSMTLRCIAGIVRPDEGRIVLDGRVLFDSAQGIDLPPSSAMWVCCSRTTPCSPT